MTEFEKRALFNGLESLLQKMDRIISLLENPISVGIDVGSNEGDETFSKKLSDVLEDDLVERNRNGKVSRLAEDREEYKSYKANGGSMKWNEWHSKKRGGLLGS